MRVDVEPGLCDGAHAGKVTLEVGNQRLYQQPPASLFLQAPDGRRDVRRPYSVIRVILSWVYGLRSRVW